MPKLIRLYIQSVAIGFAIAAGFVALLVWQDVAGIGQLILGSDLGAIAAFMLVLSHGVIFSSVQFAIRVMGLAERGQGPRGGLRERIAGLFAPRRQLIPVRAEAPAKAGRRHNRR